MLKVNFRFKLLLSTLLFWMILPWSCFAQDMPFSEITSYDIQNQLHRDAFSFITVGNTQIPIMLMQSEQVITKGVVFIIGDADMALGRTDSLTHMADALPAIGWTTVVLPSFGLSLGSNIQLPPAIAEDTETNTEELATKANAQETTQSDASGAKSSSEDSSEASDNNNTDGLKNNEPNLLLPDSLNSRSQVGGLSEADMVIYSLEIAAYLESAFEHMKNTMGHRIVISQGITAATIIKLVAEGDESTQNIDAIVINNPYWPIRKLNNKVPMIIAQTPVPLLDFISMWDNSWSQQTQKKRKTKAMTELKEVYRQSEVAGQTLNQPQVEYMTRVFKGWISYLGW
jgi:hypothetical protein